MKNDLKPASLLLELTPEYTVPYAAVSTDPDKDFQTLVRNRVNDQGEEHYVPDNWLLRFDFAHRADIPALKPGLLEELQIALETQTPEKAIAVHAIPLAEATYIIRDGMDPFARENSHNNLYEKHCLCAHGWSADINVSNHMPYMRGLRTDHGIHLFSNTDKGDDALKACLEYYANHFFDKQRSTDRLDLLTVCPLSKEIKACGDAFDEKDLGNTPVLDLPRSLFSSEKAFAQLVDKRFDLLPTLDNHWKLCFENSVSEFSGDYKTFDYCCLILLAEGDAKDPHEMDGDPEWYQDFSYKDRFNDLVDEKDDCDTQAERDEVEGRIATRAREVMEQEFPDRHYCREPEKIEAELEQSQQEQQQIVPTQEFPEAAQHKGPSL